MKETLNGFIFKCVSHYVGPKGQSTFMENGGPTQVGLSKPYFVHPNFPKKKKTLYLGPRRAWFTILENPRDEVLLIKSIYIDRMVKYVVESITLAQACFDKVKP